MNAQATFTFDRDPSTFTIAQLVEFHDANTDEPVGKWNGRKDQLIERIQGLEGYRKPTVRAVAEALLLHVDHQDENGRNVGLTYDEILDEIRQRFPEANTSVKCLRWYAVHMKDDEEVLRQMPIRPRKRVVKAEATSDES